MTNPAGAQIVNAVGPIRQIVDPATQARDERRYLAVMTVENGKPCHDCGKATPIAARLAKSSPARVSDASGISASPSKERHGGRNEFHLASQRVDSGRCRRPAHGGDGRKRTNRRTHTAARRPGHGGTDPGPRNLARDRQNPDLLVPPSTDHGTLPNLRFSFADAHMRQETGGWTRQITSRELGISKNIAGVNMRLNAGGVRELHWHKAAEWAYMLYGTARITAVDAQGRNFVDDVGVGDLWYFPAGIPHSIQGLNPDGAEFLLVFDDGDFDEDNTFLISDWFKHTPNEVLAKNFGVPASSFGHTPDPSQLYIFPGPVPGPLSSNKIVGATAVPQSFSHRLMAQRPIKTKSGTVRISDSSTPRSPRRWSRSTPAECASCIGTPTPTSGNITSRARRAWACSALRVRRVLSISAPATSAMCPSQWGTMSRIRHHADALP
jgi:oxalate decarboxylase/phosphoglucose isomerase-like protein (cupin superfamily)